MTAVLIEEFTLEWEGLPPLRLEKIGHVYRLRCGRYEFGTYRGNLTAAEKMARVEHEALSCGEPIHDPNTGWFVWSEKFVQPADGIRFTGRKK